MLKRGIILDSILGTLFIISLILMFQMFRFLGEFSFLDPIGDAIGDVEMTDLVFSSIRQTPPADQNVVLVNIGNLSRREIARELQIINQCEPAGIGVDSYFWSLKEDSLGDILLNRSLSDIENLVLVNKLVYNKFSEGYDSIRYSHPLFNVGQSGFANLETDALDQYQYKVCRNYPPRRTIDGKMELSFAVKVAQAFDPSKAIKFLDRDNAYEAINYRGNVMDYGQTKFGGRFAALDVDDVLQKRFKPEWIKGKVVIFGYLGDNFRDQSWEDKFFTPLNNKYAGRSNPDMFGAVIHANIISMILNEDYIGEQSKRSGIITAIIICFVTVLIFTWIYNRLPQWYDGLTKTIQLVMVLLLLTINIFVFHWFNYKTNLTLATILVALSGDALEVFYGLIKNLFTRGGRQLIFRVYNYK
jgi:CHASE2 domain-containing sensor protein